MVSGIKSLLWRWVALSMAAGTALLLPGCAAENSHYKQLSQQQAATIESLKAEIIRLNNEIDGTVNARGTPVPVPDQDEKWIGAVKT